MRNSRDTLIEKIPTEFQEIDRLHERIALAKLHRKQATTITLDPRHRWEIEALYRRLGYTIRASKWCPEQTELSWS